MKKIISGGYFDSKYQIVTYNVNWKSEVEKSFRFGKRLKKVTIPSHAQDAKDMFDNTLPDSFAYMNAQFRPRILETCILQINMIYSKLALERPRFRGKVSILAHSLGSVIMYDILSR